MVGSTSRIIGVRPRVQLVKPNGKVDPKKNHAIVLSGSYLCPAVVFVYFTTYLFYEIEFETDVKSS